MLILRALINRPQYTTGISRSAGVCCTTSSYLNGARLMYSYVRERYSIVNIKDNFLL